MTQPTPVARIPLDHNELVISVIDGGKIDVRMWTPTGGVRFPSKNGVTFPGQCLREALDGLRLAMSGGKK